MPCRRYGFGGTPFTITKPSNRSAAGWRALKELQDRDIAE